MPTAARDEIMGLRHKTLALEGVQFHPESILSEQGTSCWPTFGRFLKNCDVCLKTVMRQKKIP